jgi:hypothetical protein
MAFEADMPPPCPSAARAGEGTRAIGAADEGKRLLPLPRSVGGLGMGKNNDPKRRPT